MSGEKRKPQGVGKNTAQNVLICHCCVMLVAYLFFHQNVLDSPCAQSLVCCHHVTSLLVWPSGCSMPLSISDMVALQCTLLNREYPWLLPPPPPPHKRFNVQALTQASIRKTIINNKLQLYFDAGPLPCEHPCAVLCLVVFENSYS